MHTTTDGHEPLSDEPQVDEPHGDEVGVDGAGPSGAAPSGAAGAAGTSPYARASVEHLQAAARELIEAARSMLDVAEEWVNDPDVATSLTSALGTVGEVARRFAAPARRPVDGTEPSVGPSSGDAPGDDEPRIERITVT
jgi:hypothetical protein